MNIYPIKINPINVNNINNIVNETEDIEDVDVNKKTSNNLIIYMYTILYTFIGIKLTANFLLL